jgi:hypothetical protein
MVNLISKDDDEINRGDVDKSRRPAFDAGGIFRDNIHHLFIAFKEYEEPPYYPFGYR